MTMPFWRGPKTSSQFQGTYELTVRAAKVTEAQESPGVVVPVCIALVADHTASVYLQLWNHEVDALHPSDIVRLQDGHFNFHNRDLSGGPVLKAGRRGTLEKVGEFTMVFVDKPNLSTLKWHQVDSTKWGTHDPIPTQFWRPPAEKKRGKQ